MGMKFRVSSFLDQKNPIYHEVGAETAWALFKHSGVYNLVASDRPRRQVKRYQTTAKA